MNELHQQLGHEEMGPQFKVSSERPEKWGIDLATPGLIAQVNKFNAELKYYMVSNHEINF